MIMMPGLSEWSEQQGVRAEVRQASERAIAQLVCVEACVVTVQVGMFEDLLLLC